MLCVVTALPARRVCRITAETRAAGGMIYRHIAVAPDRNGHLPHKKLMRLVGDGPVLLPPEWDSGDLPTFRGTALRRGWMLTAAKQVLNSLAVPAPRRTAAVYDPDGRYPAILLELAPAAGELIVVTERRGAYIPAMRQLMDRYGAAVRFDTASNARAAMVGLAPCGLAVGVPHPPLTFAGAPSPGTGAVDGYLPAQADEWFDEVTAGDLRFLDALYEVGKMRELAFEEPTAFLRDGKKISLIGLDITKAV